MIATISIIALSIFAWPLLLSTAAIDQSQLAQAVFAAIMPILLIIVAIEFSSGELNSYRLAILGVLIALNSVVRMLGAGTAGIETVFFLVIIAGYVFGPDFGFLLGAGSLLVSAMLTAGVGPWLPFQMMAAGLVGIGAGLLPRARRPNWLFIAYAIIASFIYGGLMTLWNWPFLAGTDTAISYVPGAGFIENTAKFLQYELFTGGLIWDAGRAVTTSVLVALTAPALITTLNRAAARAGVKSRTV